MSSASRRSPLPLWYLCERLGLRLPLSVDPGTTVTGVMHDSRRVRAGDLYVGLAGSRSHGAQFAPEAARRGAVALVSDRVHQALPTLLVTDARAVVGPLAALVYGHPSEVLEVIGVTGTNGKTTTAYLVDHVLRFAGRTSGRVTTVDTGVYGRTVASPHTTPEAPDFQAALASMVEQGADSAVVEMSSHGLALGRAEGTRFAVGAFTNLSRDHHDFHGDAEAYLAAKATLFEASRCRAAVVNVDDSAGRRIAATADCPVVTVSARGAPDADWRGSDRRPGPWSTHVAVDGPPGRATLAVPLPGAHNVENAIAALALADLLDIPLPLAAEGICGFPGVPGRLERVDVGQPFLAVVDFAHNPAGLTAALTAVRTEVEGRVILVFGAPGDRDRGKRPQMGAAAMFADVVIVTTDDPYHEDPARIIADVVAGTHGPSHAAEVLVEPNRVRAIRQAVAFAGPRDAVLVAGRGHETTQEIGGCLVPLDDRAELTKALISQRATARTFGALGRSASPAPRISSPS